ncbi:histone-lysine N-methyltransferase SETDB1-A-like isoform X2 [Cottoperca gobio]|uniref:Histone-lysine N-methyltransferase SETDB1-A-like isoform X2 n=1 Tax=Cottoperca gobio TaxID=56716 RepID=A0A6J2QK92_COTGO|nr:histone-lysine N-methyltransferase SETDB1-A-like isoform X2 [Cottoperca gobio]
MEADEMEMSKEELQKWIKENVKKNKLISSDVQEKCILLQSQLEWREKQAADLLKLCKSVSTCEAIVKKQYSLLGWEYRDTDSDDDDNITSCGNTSPSSSHANGPTPLSPKLPDSNTLHTNNDKREPVVVLTRLSACQIRSLSSCRPQNRHSEDESSNYSDSDKQWEPQGDSSDSDSSILSDKTGLNKRRKIHHKDQTLAKSKGIPQASTNQYLCTSAKSSEEITSTPQEMAKTDAKSNVMKTSTPPAKSDGVSPVSTVKTPSQTSDKVTKTPPSKLLEELKVNMTVLARSRAINWQPGKIVEMVTKEDGRLKYKINFMNKKKSLLSGHHIAFDYMPKVNTLFVGARVVIKYEAEEDRFCPAFLAELPSRRNRMRFLVFIDDHTPVYVGLPSLHLVCKPCALAAVISQRQTACGRMMNYGAALW